VEIVTRPAERVNEFPYWNRKHTNAPEVQKEKNTVIPIEDTKMI
jgi:hypothetical protein